MKSWINVCSECCKKYDLREALTVGQSSPRVCFICGREVDDFNAIRPQLLPKEVLDTEGGKNDR